MCIAVVEPWAPNHRLQVTARGKATLSARSALPAIQHLGDVTLRVRPAAAASRAYDFFASAWGPFAAKAAPLPPRSGELVAHDITPLLEATRADGAGAPATSPLKVRRAYRATAKGAFELSFELTNVARDAIEVGAFGMSVPSAVSQDVHIGGAHGWVEMTRVHIADSLEVDGRRVRLAAARQRPRVFVAHKLPGELVTRSDPAGRRTIFERFRAMGLADVLMPRSVEFDAGSGRLSSNVFLEGVNLEDVSNDYAGITRADVRLQLSLRTMN